jgi:serine O-acetyltransferase
METQLATFFRKGLETFFTSYSDEWLRLAEDVFAEHRELILTDVRRKHPELADSPEADENLFRAVELDGGLEAVVSYRVQHGIFLRDPRHPALPYLARLMKIRTGAEIYYSTAVGPGFLIDHGVGAVVGPRHRIGRNFTIHQGVTLGQRRMNSPSEFIAIGDDCTLFAGAKVLGTVRLGDGVRLGANAVLLTDAEPHTTYAGIPAVKVRIANA